MLEIILSCCILWIVFQCIGRPALQVMAGIKPADGDHLVIGEHEIEHIHVLYHAFLVDRLWDDYNSLLDEEAQRHLRGCLPMDLPHLRKDGMGEDAVEADVGDRGGGVLRRVHPQRH